MILQLWEAKRGHEMIYRTELTDVRWAVLRAALVRYVIHGTIPGHFLQAVLANDLTDALCRADNTSSGILLALVRLVYNEFPSDSHGSRKAVVEWGESTHEDLRADFESNIRDAVLTNYDGEEAF